MRYRPLFLLLAAATAVTITAAAHIISPPSPLPPPPAFAVVATRQEPSTLVCDSGNPTAPRHPICCTGIHYPVLQRGRIAAGSLSGCTAATSAEDCEAAGGSVFCCVIFLAKEQVASICDPYTGNPSFVPPPESVQAPDISGIMNGAVDLGAQILQVGGQALDDAWGALNGVVDGVETMNKLMGNQR